MQSHFFAEHARHKNIQLNLVNQKDDPERQPEFYRTHAQRDQQNGNGNEKRTDVWKELTQKREHAEHERGLHANQPKRHTYGQTGDDAIDGDATRPCSHLSHEPRESAVRLLAITVGNKCQIRSHEWSWIGQYENEQQNGKHDAGYATDESDRR